MKTRILIIALALVFVSGLAIATPSPFDVSAEHDGTTIQVDWDACTSYPPCATKFSVVFYTTVAYSMDSEDPECDACVDGEVELELDYGTSDELEGLVFTGDFVNGVYMLEIEKAIVDADFDAALAEELGECYDCASYEIGTVYVKIKGLDPGKAKGRQNHEFSAPVELTEAEPAE